MGSKFANLTDDQARKLAIAEGNPIGGGVLPGLLDTALGVGSGSAAAVAAETTRATAAEGVLTTAAAAAASAAAAAQTTANNAAPKAKFVVFDVAVPGGSATPAAIAVAGLLAADKVLGLSQQEVNANSLTPIAWSVADGLLTLVYAADPGAGGSVHVSVLHA